VTYAPRNLKTPRLALRHGALIFFTHSTVLVNLLVPPFLYKDKTALDYLLAIASKARHYTFFNYSLITKPGNADVALAQNK
jgi:hypothetical protein